MNYKPFDIHDDFDWLSFVKKHHRKLYRNAKEMEKSVIFDLRRVFAIIEGGSGIYIKKTDNLNNLFDMVKKSNFKPNLVFRYKLSPKYDEEEDNGEGEIKEMKFLAFITRYFTSLPVYSSLAFRPNNNSLPKNAFNLWGRGFQAEEVKTIDMDIVNPILNHIREVWATSATGKDTEENIQTKYDYIISWYAHIIQFPYIKTGTCILVHGDQGIGKTIIGDLFQRYICGPSLATAVVGINGISKEFNGAIANKIFMKAEELSVTQDQYHSSFDKLKSIITDETVRINRKGQEEIVLDNFCNFNFFTNNSYSIKVEKFCRRYVCLDASSCKRGNEEYFKKLGNLLDSRGENPEIGQKTGNHFYTYLKRYKISVNLRNIPETSFKQSLIEKSLSTPVAFLKDIKDGEVTFNETKSGKTTILNKVKATPFYSRYLQWCEESGEKYVDKRKFGAIKGKHITFGKKNDGWYYYLDTIEI